MAIKTFDEQYYLQNNPDVLVAVSQGHFASGLAHYLAFGAKELRDPNAYFDAEYYAAHNPDVLAAVNAGVFSSVLEHYELYGEAEGRAFADGMTFSEQAYLDANPDVAAAVESGVFSSGYQHFVLYGAAEGRTMDGSANGVGLTLTNGIDNLTGTVGDDVFTAPVVQNALGGLTNSLETGDRLVGGAGTDALDIILMDVGANATGSDGPAISATTSGIEIVNIRAQEDVSDVNVNESDIDAELMADVEEFWTVNSRSDVQIEDVRSLPEAVTFGMRQTDPGVGFNVYFDPAQLSADRSSAGDSSLTLTLVDNANPGSLADFPVSGVTFSLAGTSYQVTVADSFLDGTYASFTAGLQAALAAIPALVAVTATLNANNSITLLDPAGATFATGGYLWVDGVTPANGNLSFNQSVGDPIVSDAPITTEVMLDAVGRTSQGGLLDIGSMGDGGVETFNVTVDRSSWLSGMTSREDFGDGDLHLETVNLASTGSNGDLKVGDSTNFLDGRVASTLAAPGLVDVRVVDGSTFAGDLTLAMTLTDDAIGRYLDEATGEVQFTYTGGAGNDNFNVAVSTALSGDPDFALDILMGEGDDRLNLAAATASNVTVDGGTGENTIAVSTSHGTTGGNTFEGFSNFQTYEIEGITNTEHDFTSMAGVTAVNVATGASGIAGGDTTLIDLPTVELTITGQNQTLGNDSNNDQGFGTIEVSGADTATLAVILDNTARIDGVLTVDQLLIDNESAANVSAVRTLDLESGGARSTSNVITDLDAALVNTFNLTGSQDLTVSLSAAANSTAAAANRGNLVVDASALAGTLDLTVDAGILTSVDAAANHTNTLTGTAGDADLLTLDGAIATTADTTVSAFETIEFVNSSGSFVSTNVTGVGLYDISDLDGDLALTALGAAPVVRINTDDVADGDPTQDQDLTLVAAGQASTNALTVEYRDADILTDTDSDLSFGGELLVQDYRSITLDLGGDSDTTDAYTLDLNLLDEEGRDDTDGAYDEATVYARTLNVTGGGDEGDVGSADGVDSVNLGTLSSALTQIDFSDYVGAVTASMDTLSVSNTTISVNGYGLNFTQDALSTVITTYAFTTDAVTEDEDWTIANFREFNGVPGASLSDLSILDLSGLGVEGLADIVLTDVAGDLHITSNTGLNFEIVLTGVAAADLSNENFSFA